MEQVSYHPEIKLPSVSEFVEGVALLFHLGTKQSEKLTLARSYTSMQDRYALLDGTESAILIETLVGISVYPQERPQTEVKKIVSRHFDHMQQLASWIQASFVYQAPSQGQLNMSLLELFVTPQLSMLLLSIFEDLPEYSPLKQLDLCIEALIDNEYDPVRACKDLLRYLLNESLKDKDLINIGFSKNLNALDWRSTKTPSTIKQELLNLDHELAACLKESERKELIHKMSGVYTSMMALKRLHKLVDQWHPACFKFFIDKTLEDLLAFSQDYLAVRHSENNDLLQELYASDSPVHAINSLPTTSPAFNRLLSSSEYFSSSDEPASLQAFLHNGLSRGCVWQTLESLQSKLEDFRHKAYYPVIKSFILGALAISNQDTEAAEKYFDMALDASRKWPVGVIRSQAALFCLGLKLSKNTSHPPRSFNPLLSIYISSLPQTSNLQAESDIVEDANEFNLRQLIFQYNIFCSELSDNPTTILINPLSKIENHLQIIFSELRNRALQETEENLRKVSIELTGKRERQRVKSDYLNTSLYHWLKAGDMREISLYFGHPKSLSVIPAICRYLEMPEELRNAIITGADPKRDKSPL